MFGRRRRNPPVAVLLAIPALIMLALGRKKKRKRSSGPLPSVIFGEHPFPLPEDRGAPFAEGVLRPTWPIHKDSKNKRKYEVPYRDLDGKYHGNMARRFKSDRGARWHAGVDIYANVGDVVLAPESGTVLGSQHFKDGTHAVLLYTDTGLTILIGEVEKGSWVPFGATPGKRIEQGEPVAKIGIQDSDPKKPGIQGGAHMLHLETYEGKCSPEPCVNKNLKWPKNGTRDPRILDPTDYMLRAKVSVTPVANA